MSSIIIGVDGGGTHTRLVAVHPDGSVAGVGHGDSLNYYNIGMAAARAHLREAVDRLLLDIGEADYGALSIGVSALDHTGERELVCEFCGDAFDPARTRMESDVFMGLFGMTLGAPGVMVVCGTGSIIVLLDAQGVQHVTGGWGHLVGDEGSAYALARDGIRAAIDQWEGGGKETALSSLLLRAFQTPESAPRRLVERLYGPLIPPRELAAYAPLIMRAAQEGDAVALHIVETNIDHLARTTSCLMSGYPDVTRVGLWGGVMENSSLARDIFDRALRARVPAALCALPDLPPALGAAAYEMNMRGMLVPDAVRRVREGWAACRDMK